MFSEGTYVVQSAKRPDLENKRINDKTMGLDTKNKGAAGYRGTAKIEKVQDYRATVAFLENQQQLVNSGNKMPFPKMFGNLNFQLKNSNRSNFGINVMKYFKPGE